MVDPNVDPASVMQGWLYYRDFGQAYDQAPEPTSDSERLTAKLRQLQRELFSQQVQIADLPDRLDNPPQSLAEILQNRLADTPITVATPGKPTSSDFRQAIKRGVGAALLFLIVLGLVFLIKSLS